MTRKEELRVEKIRQEASERLAARAAAIEEFELTATSSVCYRANKFPKWLSFSLRETRRK
jgi:hypothetical protein